MNDDQLSTLIRMAVEAERLESPLHIEHFRAVPPVRRSVLWKLAPLAAAAAVLLAVMIVPRFMSQPESPDEIAINTDPAPVLAPEVVVAKPSAEGSMLVAVYREADDRCGSVVWVKDAFAGRAMADVSRTELVEAALKGRGDARTGLMLVVGLQGPREMLPDSHAAAEALAQCMTVESCGVEAPCYAATALGCLPSNVRIVTETVGMAR